MEAVSNEAEQALIARIAWLYYNDGLTQSEIGDLLAMSRIKVSRLLDAGREAGLIQIRVNTLHHGCHEAEVALKARFGLADCRVIPAARGDLVPALSARLGEAAAQYLMQKLQPGQMLAAGWGETVSASLRKLGHVAQERQISLVTLTGGVQTYVDGLRAANWERNVFIVPAPLVVGDADLARMLGQERSVATLLDMAVAADFKLVGLGGVEANATVVKQGFIAPSEVEPLRRMGAVGDVLFRFFDREGRELDLPLHDRVIGIGLDRLRETRNVIAAAGGKDKVAPIRGAIRGRLLDILITDEDTARQLLTEE